MARTVAMVIAGAVVAAIVPSRAAESGAAVAPPVTVSATPLDTVADVKLRMRSGAWLLNADVRNLFEKEYFSYGVLTGRPAYSAFPAAGRSAFVSAQYAFG